MDDPAIDETAHRLALRQLDRINRASLADRPISQAILEANDPTREIRLLDVATGSGRVAASVVQALRRRGRAVRLTLCDVSETALDVASSHAEALGIDVSVVHADVTEGLPLDDRSVDVVMNSLFLHHLDEPEVVGALREFARVAKVQVVVSDLRRCRPGHLAARGAGLLSLSPIVRVDAPRSVEGAFTEHELRDLVIEAGLPGARLHRIIPFRLLATWTRPGGSS